MVTGDTTSAGPFYPQGQIIVSENFESGGWEESFWTENWCKFSYSCQIVDNPSGGGKVFRSVYNPNNCSSSDRSTMGDELNSPSLPYDEHWLGVRIYFDSRQFGPDNNSLSLVQYHGKPDFDQGERWRDGISMLRYRFGELYMSYIGSKHRVTPYENGKHVYTERDTISLGKPKLDAWNTFVFHIKWDPTGDNGTLEIWHDGKYHSRKNINFGYNDERKPSLKFGQYGWTCKTDDMKTRTSYTDNLRISVGPNAGFCDVVPPGATLPNDIRCQ